MTEDRKVEALKAVRLAATVATAFVVLVVIAVAIPLAILSNELDEKVVEIIEGISKVVAAVCIIQLSVKIPVFLGTYKKVSILPWKKYEPKAAKSLDDLNNKEIYFNVGWNLWREVAECGVFLLPFFLENSNLKAIPISAVVGFAVGIGLGLGIYIANHHMKQKFWLCFCMAGLTLFLAVGLFTGGMHEFEEVWGETKTVWEISNDFFSHKDFPFVLLKPFGWSSKRTVLQICSFWCSLAVGLSYHYLKWRASKKVREMYPDEESNESPSVDEESGKAKEEDQAAGSGSENDC